MAETDYKLKVWIEVDTQIDQNGVKKGLEKTGESAGEGIVQGLQKKKEAFLDQIKNFWQAGKKELDKDLVADLKLNKAHLQHQLDELNRQLKQAKKANQHELEYENRLKIDETKGKLNQTTSALNGLGKSWQSVGEMLIGLASKLGIWFGLAQAVQFVIKTFNDFQESQKILVQATGASGEALKKMSENVLHLQSSVNQGQSEIAEAVGEINTRLGLTWDELEKTTENYLKFATVTGQNGKEAIADNIRLFNIWGVSAQDQALYLDQLAFAGQATGVNVGTLTKNLTDNQVALEQMGLWLTESIALLSNFEKEGVNADQALAAMKIGIANLVKEGKSPTEAINTLVESIKNAKTETEWMHIAVETFWQRGGLAMYNAIRRGTLSVEEFTQTLNNAQGTVNETHKNMETFGEWISRIFSGIWGSFVADVNDGFSQIWSQVMWVIWIVWDFFDEVGKWIGIIWEIINGERDWTLAMTEKGYEMERQKNLVKQSTEVNKKYVDTAQKLNTALNTFNSIKVDDSATREEFEASRKQALATAEGFRQALKAKLAFTRWVSAWLDKWSKDYADNAKLIAALEAEGKNLDQAIEWIKNSKYTWTGRKKPSWGGSGWWSKGKSVVEKKKEELIKLRDLEIKAVQESSATEFEKMAKLYDIDRAYKKKIEDLEGKTNDVLLKTAEQYMKESYEKKLKASQEEQKLTNDAIKKAEEYQKTIKKSEKAWEDLKNKATDTLRSINHEIEELNKDYSKDLWARWVEVRKQIIDNQRDTPGLEHMTERYNREELERWREAGTKEVEWVDLDRLLEQIKLKEELLLIEKSTTKEQQEQAKALSQQSETQKIMAKHKEELAKKEEYRNLLKAYTSSESLGLKGVDYVRDEHGDKTDKLGYRDAEKKQYIEITDFKNQEYARDLLNQQEKLKTEYAEAQENYAKQLELVKSHSANVYKQRQNDSRAYRAELEKRKADVQKYVEDVRRILSSVPSAHRAYGGELTNGRVALVGENGPEQIIARASSYVQPRNAITNHSVVNTTNTQSYNLNMGDAHFGPFATIDDMLAALKSKLTYHF